MHDARQRAMLTELGLGWAALLPPAPAEAPPASVAADAPAAGPQALAPPASPPPGPGASRTLPPPGPAHAAEGPEAAGRPEGVPAQPPAMPTASRRMQASDAGPDAGPASAAEPPTAGLRGPAPQAAELAALDWDGLAARVAGCRACGLCEGRRQAVLDAGPRRADWMVIGEGPGEQEDRQGAPFVGPSGQLLDRMLAAVGASRQGAPADAPEAGRPEGVYIANAVKCRPPGNRNPTAEEVLRCRPYLQAQIERVQPRLLLLLGRFAVQSVLGREDPIGRLRGSVHEALGRPAIVTYHPAYLLRSPLEKAKAWDDLCRARALLARLRGDGA